MSDRNNIEHRAIIILWEGKALCLNGQKDLIATMANAGVITADHPTVVELNSVDLAKAAYLKATVESSEEAKLPDEVDPVLHSIEVIGTKYNGLTSNQFTVKIFGDVIAQVHKRSCGLPRDLEFISAIDVLSNHTITAKYASALKKYGVNKTMLEIIRNAYNAYNVNQDEFI